MEPMSKAGEVQDAIVPEPVPASFLDLMGGCTKSVLHLEMRDCYARDTDFQRWQAGDRFDPAERWPEWFDLMAGLVARGVPVQRARIVSQPVTDYIRYEHAITDALNVASGEDVRWLPRRSTSDLALPGNDFWLFDEQTALFNHFAGDGSSGPKELRTESEVVELCRTAFTAVWERAIPHAEFVV